MTVWVSPDYTRAAPGGTGAAKCGGNYAARLVAQAEAIEHGCDQVVFLDAVERRYVDELGGMNVFFVFDDGTHRDAAADRHDPARHHPRLGDHAGPRRRARGARSGRSAIEQWRADAASGRLREAFACGTAAVVTPIGTVRHPATASSPSATAARASVTTRLRQRLVDIQRGRAEDPHGWVHRVL